MSAVPEELDPVVPRLSTLLLSDFAQVRDRLLFVSSGGISRVVQSTFPAHPRIHLALVVHLPVGTLGRAHRVLIKLKYPDQAALIAQIEMKINIDEVAGANAGEGINVPQVIDLAAVTFARPGQVDVQVSIDDAPAGDLTFWMLPTKQG
ncbi:MAG: hypothetical protein HY826_11675 [Actinobacteria bacterium]|nr:hypothetical protein [Actinomycetota bacterium]